MVTQNGSAGFFCRFCWSLCCSRPTSTSSAGSRPPFPRTTAEPRLAHLWVGTGRVGGEGAELFFPLKLVLCPPSIIIIIECWKQPRGFSSQRDCSQLKGHIYLQVQNFKRFSAASLKQTEVLEVLEDHHPAGFTCFSAPTHLSHRLNHLFRFCLLFTHSFSCSRETGKTCRILVLQDQDQDLTPL